MGRRQGGFWKEGWFMISFRECGLGRPTLFLSTEATFRKRSKEPPSSGSPRAATVSMRGQEPPCFLKWSDPAGLAQSQYLQLLQEASPGTAEFSRNSDSHDEAGCPALM